MSSVVDAHVTIYPLPTLDSLKATVPTELDAHDVMTRWFADFSASIESQNVDGILHLFLPSNSFWRDFLAFTWDFRLFPGPSRISQFLRDQLPEYRPRNLRLRENTIGVQRPYPDLCWVSAMFDFTTAVGICSGVIRLVPTHELGVWKAHIVFTNLEDLHGFPEQCGTNRNGKPNHGQWENQRQELMEDYMSGRRNPTVLIVGAGQSGLTAAARLKTMDVSVLIVERNQRVGDNWRNRYEALCLHDPICMYHWIA
ncbi:hypothetical protein NP233_g12568 [Leucocoprinus birnbaumii]|uniref:FAD/NAD(P)-binding domain-containing protein n=1 Tax=Leucocoprinus birnbaumii TaxID=56174 RepID=A0AAD5YJC0_9AGAR|nr:hypothetical protein NP233_g12568 [Leucocoprinus birnbaumii]